MNLTFKVQGKEFVFRKFTEEEACKISDKKIVAVNDFSHNLMDDGDEEILKLLISPSKDEAKSLVQKYGQFLDQVFSKMIDVCGNQEVFLDDSFDEKKASSEQKAPVIQIKWKTGSLYHAEKECEEEVYETILFKRISYADTKIIKREMVKKGMMLSEMLVPRARSLCIEKEKAEAIVKEHPFFFVNVGRFLWEQTRVEMEENVKKS